MQSQVEQTGFSEDVQLELLCTWSLDLFVHILVGQMFLRQLSSWISVGGATVDGCIAV